MHDVPLAGTGLTTSTAVLGTMTFGAQLDEDAATACVRAALERGVTHFDCANSYTGGEAERILGRALGSDRDRVIVTTKAFNPVDGVSGLTPDALKAALDASLVRLGTDRVDLFYLHQPDHGTPIEDTLGALEDVVAAGKARVPAMSNYAAWQLAEARGIQAENDWTPVHVAQQMYNLITRDLENEYEAFATRFDVSTLVYNPLAGGLLTGKYRATTDEVAEGTRFSGAMYAERYWHERQFEAVKAATALADQAGITPVELALRWTLSKPVVTGVILGASSLSQLEANLAAIEAGPLEQDLLDSCETIWHDLRGPLPRYNR